MRVLFCVPVPSVFALHRHSHESIPKMQFHALWLKAFKSLKWKVTVFRYTDTLIIPKKWVARIEVTIGKLFPRTFARWRRFLSIIYDLRLLNYLRSLKLLLVTRAAKPDAIFFVKGCSELVSFPFLYAKRKHIPIVFFSGEDPSIAATPFERDIARFFDFVITNDPTHNQLWHHYGAKNTITLPYAAIEPSVHKKLKLKPDLDVVFLGTLTKVRQHDLRLLVASHLNLAVFGFIPPLVGLHPDLKSIYHGEAWPLETAKIYNRAQIALNFVENTPSGGNLRLFEIAGCGTFQLSQACRKEWFIPGKEIVIFKTRQDLIRKINYYLKYPRKRRAIAAAAYLRAHKYHTYQKRFKAIYDLLKRRRPDEKRS